MYIAIAVNTTGFSLIKRVFNMLVMSATGTLSFERSEQLQLTLVIDQCLFVDRLYVYMCGGIDTELISHALADTMHEDVFYRFNPVDPAFECDLDETNYDKLLAMTVRTSIACLVGYCELVARSCACTFRCLTFVRPVAVCSWPRSAIWRRTANASKSWSIS